MEINDGTYTISFKAVDHGEVFRYKDHFYMAIVPLEENNAVNLETGEMEEFNDEEIVKQVNVTLRVDY